MTKLEDKILKKCIDCKERTYHTIHGFEYHNRRHKCTKCGYERWDGKTEEDAPLE